MNNSNNKKLLNSIANNPNLMAILSCLMYSFCSVGMVLSNKAISTSIPDKYVDDLPQISVVLYQNVIAVLLVEISRIMGWIEYQPFSFQVAKSWLPLNVLFVGMLCSGFFAISYVNVPMVTIFKNLTNIITVFGDYYLFGEKISPIVVISILIMVFGAVMAGFNDIEFNFIGYFWMVINCLFTASNIFDTIINYISLFDILFIISI